MNIAISKNLYRRVPIAIFLFTILLYGNSLKNEYALDDEIVTLNNPRVEKGIWGIPQIFTTHHTDNIKQSYGYRPIVLSTYALEYQLFGNLSRSTQAHISHFINVILYAISCILIFSLLCKLLESYHIIFPLLITFLFLAHPLHTEVVNNLKCRDELLCFLFCLLTIRHYLNFYDTKEIKYLLYGLLMFVLAFLSKITAFLLLLLIPLIIYFFRKIEWKQLFISFFTILLAIITFRIIKQALFQGSSVRNLLYFENPLFYEGTFSERIPVAFYTLAYYVKLLVLPHPLSFYYGYNQVALPGWSNVIVWMSLLCCIGIVIFLIRKFPEKNILAFGIVFFLIAIAPFTNLLVPVVGIIGERFAYIASLGFCIVIAYLLLRIFNIPFNSKAKIIKLNTGFLVIILAVFGLYVTKVITRNPDWKDHLTLYRHDVKHLDRSAKAHSLLGLAIYTRLFDMPPGQAKNNMVYEAKKHFERALEIYPEYTVTYNNLGTIYFSFLSDYKSALPNFQKAIDLDPTYTEAHYNLGFTYELLGNLDSAIILFNRTLELGEKHNLAYERLNNLYFAKEEYENIIRINRKGIKAMPDNAMFHINIANAYSLQNDTINALNSFIKAFEVNPADYELCMHIAQIFSDTHNEEEANKYFEIAMKLR